MQESVVEKRLAEMLGTTLRDLRAARELTQEQVALAAGISRNHYQLLESGLSKRDGAPANPRLSTLIAISSVLDITVPDLVTVVFAEVQPAR